MSKCLQILICAFFITVFNNTNHSANCFIYWVDHPFKYNFPVNVHGGEYDPGESFKLSAEYIPGIYKVRWTIPRGEDTKIYLFKTRATTESATLTPSGATQK